jgi:hypothetical protein
MPPAQKISGRSRRTGRPSPEFCKPKLPSKTVGFSRIRLVAHRCFNCSCFYSRQQLIIHWKSGTLWKTLKKKQVYKDEIYFLISCFAFYKSRFYLHKNIYFW